MFSPGASPRIAMIDMDAGFCMDVKSEPNKRTKDAPVTTIADLHRRLAARTSHDPDDELLESVCVSLLIHCVVSAVYPHDTSRLYGFPYPRIAACLYQNWNAVWQMVFRPEEAGARWHTDAYMLGFYYNMNIENPEHRTIYPEDSEKVKSAIASALRAPMTRVLLMTKGLDVSSAIEIVDIQPRVVVSGDLYVRLARIYANEVQLEYDIINALNDSTDPVQKLEEFVRDWDFAASPFTCRLSASKQQVSCIHETCCLESLESPESIESIESPESRRTDKRAKRAKQDESAKEKKWRDRVAVPGKVPVRLLDRVQTARFLCDLMTRGCPVISPIGGSYYTARRIYKYKQWTGEDIVKLVKDLGMVDELEAVGIPRATAQQLGRTIADHVHFNTPIETLGPCKPCSV